VSWGSGQNAAYAYLAMPFVANDLTVTATRMPMLIVGSLSILLMYYVGSRLFGRMTGLFSAFLLAVSPWHIMLSRWALESNLLPAAFLAAFACLIAGVREPHWRPQAVWLSIAGFLFSACLYTYGTAYVAVPLFLAIAGVMVIARRAANLQGILAFCGTFVLLSAPIWLFLAVNSLHLQTLHLGAITIPRLPVMSRYEQLSLLSSSSPLTTLGGNARALFDLLRLESDGSLYNTIPRYGLLYHLLLPVGCLGLVLLVDQARRSRTRLFALLLLGWVTAGLVTGILGPMNVNRANIIPIPVFIAIAMVLTMLARRVKALAVVAVLAITLACAFFARTYYSDGYRAQVGPDFQAGYVEAMRLAHEQSSDGVCVLSGGNMPYIYSLFVDPIDPRVFAATVTYSDPEAPMREVSSYGRYAFANCQPGPRDAAIARGSAEPPPLPPGVGEWSAADFGGLTVYSASR
jgi:4-amino-4-deoxy-L-arabinose transferase-like glycosyltransferase